MELNLNFFGFHNKLISYALVTMVFYLTFISDLLDSICTAPGQLHGFVRNDSVAVFVYITPFIFAAFYFYCRDFFRHYIKKQYTPAYDLILIVIVIVFFYILDKFIIKYYQELINFLIISDIINNIHPSPNYLVVLGFIIICTLFANKLCKNPIKYFFVIIYILINVTTFLAAIDSIIVGSAKPDEFIISYVIVMGINIVVWLVVSILFGYLEDDSINKLKNIKKELDTGSISSSEFQKQVLDVLSK